MKNILLLFVILGIGHALAASPRAVNIYSYVFSDSVLAQLGTLEKILQIVEKQRDIVKPDTSSLLLAFEKDLKDFPDAVPYITSFLRKNQKMHSLLQDSFCSEDQGWDCAVKQIWLDSTDIENLKDSLRARRHFPSMRPEVLRLLQDLGNYPFPHLDLFHKAVESRLAMGLSGCSELPSRSDPTHTKSLTPEELNTLEQQWAKTAMDSTFFNILRKIRIGNGTCSSNEWQQSLNIAQYYYLQQFKSEFTALATTYYPFDSDSLPQWKSSDCGCSQIESMNGTVYGFFPFWQPHAPKQIIDFSTLTRIAFYGLTFDQEGALQYPNSLPGKSAVDPSPESLDFIRQAHKYNTRVDWVLQKSDWNTQWLQLTPEQKARVFDKLTQQITNLLSKRLEDPLTRLVAKITFDAQTARTQGDGVNLFFSNYPSDSISQKLFEDFFRKLKQSLRKKGSHYYVNIMVTHASMQKSEGIHNYTFIRKLLDQDGLASTELDVDSQDIEDSLRTYVLLFLDEPTILSRQALRNELDQNLHGYDHKVMLRSLIPVFTIDYKNWDKLHDDITYFNDAFYGLGFWPLVSADPQLSKLVRNDFFKDEASPTAPGMIQKFVCVHRIGMRLAFLLNITLLALLGVLCMAFCQIRHFLGKYPVLATLVAMIPPIVLFGLLLYNDPALSKVREGNIPLMIMLVILILGGAGVALIIKNRRDYPVRENNLEKKGLQ